MIRTSNEHRCHATPHHFCVRLLLMIPTRAPLPYKAQWACLAFLIGRPVSYISSNDKPVLYYISSTNSQRDAPSSHPALRCCLLLVLLPAVATSTKARRENVVQNLSCAAAAAGGGDRRQDKPLLITSATGTCATHLLPPSSPCSSLTGCACRRSRGVRVLLGVL